MLIALELLRLETEGDRSGAHRNVALVPLGTPLLAGPGTIATAMLYMRRADGMGGIAKVLKDDGIDLVSRVMGLILAAIAVQLVASGIASWIENGV